MTVPNTAQSIDRVGRFRTSIDDCATSSGRDAAAGPDGLQNAMLGVYRLDGVIGAGAVGVVYRAWNCRSDRDVAVKVLSDGLLATPEQRRRFRMEAIALGRCAHRNVAALLDFGTSHGRDYLVMELVEGQPISEMLNGEALSSAHAAFLGEQLARGLAAAHAAGVIHRDIKPGNVRVTPSGHLKIVDFGLARPGGQVPGRAVTSPRGRSGIAGTVPYMAPEQVTGAALDGRTDVYGAGAVLYEMACGRRAFSAGNLTTLLDDIRLRLPDSPSTCNATIWPSLEIVIMKALAKRPEDRFESAAELADRLARITSPAEAAPAPTTPRWRSMTTGVVRALGLASRPAQVSAGIR